MRDIGNDIINPALILAISRMKEHNTVETQTKMAAEAMKSRFLIPCTMVIKPGTEKEEKRNAKNTRPQFTMVKTDSGELYFPTFTDIDELKKWGKADQIGRAHV
mgnify:CR=1 FL=1